MDGCTVSVRFARAKLRDKHWRLFCCGRYDYCEIYRMVMEAKYDE